MSLYYVLIITSFVVGLACAMIAQRRKKDPLLWFLAGVVFNVVALAFILTSSKVVQAAAKRPR